MSRYKQRKSLLERAEEGILEHIPDKYQKSVVGVYRFGYCLNIIGIMGAILSLFAAVSCCFLGEGFDATAFMTSLVLLAISFGAAVLGAQYLRMKMSPPSAFGWAVAISLIGFAAAGFLGFTLFAAAVTDLDSIYGQTMMFVIKAIVAVLMVLPLVIFLNAIYYLFFAHKGYVKWYADYAKRHHLEANTKATKKRSSSNDYNDDDL